LIRTLGLLGCLFALTCASVPTRPPEKTAMQDAVIDHVIVGIADLDQGIRLLTAMTGVAPERGGQHPGRGTQNALLSLGPRTYLELIAPVGGPPPEMEFLSSLQQLTPIGWAIGSKDLDGTKSRLEAAGFKVTPPRDGSRVRPDGQVLQWRTAGLGDVPVPGDLTPFLIEWSAQTAHPASTSPGGCMLESMEIVGPRVEKLNQLVAELRLGAAVRSGTAPDLILTLRCPAGQVRLSSTKP
jgi:Glyoxalase-like domain